ncbi:cytochrome c, class I [Babesia caballi]|uniref:Cytochrome c, class I n=1 Tax=Babesia caballi TaxID=5871 RepID=A0AAV4LS54_BABCB|nr:cytochrome c, class I [Babesia caballi]
MVVSFFDDNEASAGDNIPSGDASTSSVAPAVGECDFCCFGFNSLKRGGATGGSALPADWLVSQYKGFGNASRSADALRAASRTIGRLRIEEYGVMKLRVCLLMSVSALET